MLSAAVLGRSLLSDVSCALIFASIVVLLPQKRIITLLCVFVYSLTYASNIANLGINFSNLHIGDSRFLTDEQFLIKSLSSPLIIGTLLTFILSYFVILHVIRKKLPALPYHYGLPILAFPLLLVFIPLNAAKPFWQQYNVFEENVVAIFATLEERPYRNFLETDHEYARFMRLELPEEKIAPLATIKDKKPNVLVITIEGLSEQFMQDGVMPNLKQLADENIHYENFVYHQRFTENGLYSILCGDMPTLYRRVLILSTTKKAMPEMVIIGRKNSPNKWINIAYGRKNNCLPRILNSIGYNTTFFQASDLLFSKKNLFMKNAGIKEQFGDKKLRVMHPHLDTDMPYAGLTYGMPDGVFYPRVHKELKKMHADGKPWFATLMTTSTHFPLFIKKEFKGKFGNDVKEAFYTADSALQDFITALKNDGLLDNTLLIVTGDESGAQVKNGNIASMLASNWGTLVIKTPDNSRYASKDYFTHADLMTSILDYIGSSEKAVSGRSVFRKYGGFRPIMFSNIRTDRWFAWYAPDKIVACANYFKICNNLKLEGDLFDAKLSNDKTDKNLTNLYISVARKSDYLLTPKKPIKQKRVPSNRKKNMKKRYNFFSPNV